MTFDSLALQRAATVAQLMMKKQYGEAAVILREENRRRPEDAHVMMQLADAYAGLGNATFAVRILGYLADQLAARGFPGKAVTALKRIQRIDPSQPQIYDRIASLIEQGRNTDLSNVTHAPFEFPPEGDADTSSTREFEMPEHMLHTEAFVGSSLRVMPDERLEEGVPSPLFDDFSREELMALMHGLELQVYDPGDVIVAQGDAGASLFIVASGILKAFVKHDTKHRQVRTLHDGDFFGEISILRGTPRTATVTAATRCELLELDRATLDNITARHPRVKEVIQRYADERVASDRSMA
jgi:hypothetical protein